MIRSSSDLLGTNGSNILIAGSEPSHLGCNLPSFMPRSKLHTESTSYRAREEWKKRVCLASFGGHKRPTNGPIRGILARIAHHLIDRINQLPPTESSSWRHYPTI